jgi:competence protein ComEC
LPRILFWPSSIVTGCLAVSLFTAIPSPAWLASLTVLCLFALAWRATRWAAVALLALCLALFQYGQRIEDRLEAAQSRAVVEVTGTVASVPTRQDDLLRFRFEPAAEAEGARLPRALRVSWYHEPDEAPDVGVGQRWRLELSLQPPWGRVNFRGGDPERWLFANGYGGLGTVRNAERLENPGGAGAPVQSARERVGRAIRGHLDEPAGRGVVLALATADRSALDEGVRELLVDTGTAHLLAISGLHVGLAAAAGYGLVRLLLAPFGAARRGRRSLVAAATGGLLSAFGYALLADLGVSTLRAVAMVGVVLLAMVSARVTHPAGALAWAAALVLLADPFAPLGAGFWFSFLAVTALLAAFVPHAAPFPAWQRPLRAQLAVTVALLPVSAAWFGLASVVALPANLLAIPWVSFLVVPPVLAGVVALPFAEGLAAACWNFASESADWLLRALRMMAAHGPQPLGLNGPDRVQLALAGAGAFVLLLPSALRWKWLALFLVAPLLLPATFVAPGRDGATLEVLDTGQGTAALLHTANHTLLYDTGPGDGRSRDLVRSAILPALGTAAPDRVVVSHADLDHAGGLQSLARRFPETDIRLNAATTERAGCVTGWSWAWDETRFRALHPSPGLPYLGNDSSCTLSVTGPAARILLPGDVSQAIEQRLLDEGLQPHDLLLVPHHGSASSSGAEFLARLRPRLAVATAALGNRFDFPRDEVRERYRAAGIPLLTTGECGALRIRLEGGTMSSVESARRQRNRVWRWPAAAHCP